MEDETNKATKTAKTAVTKESAKTKAESLEKRRALRAEQGVEIRVYSTKRVVKVGLKLAIKMLSKPKSGQAKAELVNESDMKMVVAKAKEIRERAKAQSML